MSNTTTASKSRSEIPVRTGNPVGRLESRLRKELAGEVLFDDFSRGRYSTDASIYQMLPLGIAIPQNDDDVRAILTIATEESVPVLPRGGGTSQCGQTVNEALVIDTSRYLTAMVDLDTDARRATVQPGLVLDQLNAALKSHGLFFPVDVSTSSRATIGGMTGNNSCGARSIRYGNTVHNVHAIDAIMADGNELRFQQTSSDLAELSGQPQLQALAQMLRDIEKRERDEIAARWPKVFRNVGGYNINTINPEGHNLASMLVGSEGTLAWFRQIEVDLAPLPTHKVLGVCRFRKFHDAMVNTQHIVELKPAAVELVDRNMIDLGAEIETFRGVLSRIANPDTDAILLVEFAGEDLAEQQRSLAALDTLLADLGFADAVLKVEDDFQKDIWEVRKAGLNIMMSMKGDAKPVSFVEDCAVPLEHLGDYTARLTEVFERHGTRGTWYAHASVGCLHVRPVLDMKSADGGRTMRAIAEQALALVREYQGAHSGEHGDGIVRSEWLEPMLGSRIARAFEQIKDGFDPQGRFNPGKIVRPPEMDDRSLFRFKPDYQTETLETGLDWSDWGGLSGAAEMCNNNGACRKAVGGVMCPSYRATGEEAHLTRGRANTLRLALSGQLGTDALLSDAMEQTMSLCVSCKGCRRECPTGVDMARMKLEYLYQRNKNKPLSLRERLVTELPKYAPMAKQVAPLLNLRDRVPGIARAAEKLTAIDARRSLPSWHRQSALQRIEKMQRRAADPADCDVVFMVDTFNNYFEPDNIIAALRVFEAAGMKVDIAEAPEQKRPLCCGRTFLAAGRLDQARAEATRTLDALTPWLDRGVRIVGLEPSCMIGMRDEYGALLKDSRVEALAQSSMLFEEFLATSKNDGKINLALGALKQSRALLHGHCHQKAFDLVGDVERVLRWIPRLQVETIDSSCCGMAGAFGYEREHFDISMQMAEASLLPAVRAADADTLIVADGTSCRHQIHDGAQATALHVARVLEMAIDAHPGD